MNHIKTLQDVFDTRRDTKKIFVAMTHNFAIRNDKRKDGKSLLFLIIRKNGTKKTMNLDIKIEQKYWDDQKKRVKKSENFESFNIILDTIEAKITIIKRDFFLAEKVLTPELLIDALNNNIPEFDFISFCLYHIDNSVLAKNTIKQQKTVINKLKEYRKEIPFSMLSLDFFDKYKKYLLTKKGNSDPTCFTDFKVIKKFINLADDRGIKLPFDKKKFIVQEPKTIPTFLLPEEVSKLVQYFFSEFIAPIHSLPLGYFLFSCYTGLRISDIQNLKRKDIEMEVFNFSHIKSKNFQPMRINDELRKIIDFCPSLFVDRLSDQKINKHLKTIAVNCRIAKNLTMHVGRHTFATTILINDGSIAKLQKLLGHTKISNTMRYGHLVDDDALSEIEKVTFFKKE
ncbi:Tyrosine recombinase XerC [Chryseobacterium nakagawai]|uniref:Site-specific integrase n=1 Tax=Chryseobacterium nakagawai TaxID=1241982 RepID=A0AAD0YU58_CHRNA|nr:site-specific integrase [Chryseobacterium nakagawai]AZA93061.1 site-specific integrase [Chryseobacterium nakagawai]VEH19694.1 Tyrosine recombinase XerC [Chryseobacterium nakagawai]